MIFVPVKEQKANLAAVDWMVGHSTLPAYPQTLPPWTLISFAVHRITMHMCQSHVYEISLPTSSCWFVWCGLVSKSGNHWLLFIRDSSKTFHRSQSFKWAFKKTGHFLRSYANSPCIATINCNSLNLKMISNIPILTCKDSNLEQNGDQ